MRIPERPSKHNVIEACTLLNSLKVELREELVERSFLAYAEKGELIWLAGAPADFSAIVATGFVKMTKSSAQGADVAMELLGPGQAFGLMASIEGRDFPLNASAVTNTWYLKIPTREIKAIYDSSVEFKDQIVRAIGPRLRKAHEMMVRLSSGRVEERLAAVLFILADSYGKSDERGVHLQVPLTRQDLSEMAGTTVETTIRIMSRWQKEHIVTTDNQSITIHDQDALSLAVTR